MKKWSEQFVMNQKGEDIFHPKMEDIFGFGFPTLNTAYKKQEGEAEKQ